MRASDLTITASTRVVGALTSALGSLSDEVPLRHTLFDGVGGVGEPVWHARRPAQGKILC
jgi:hypothetical protein